MGQPPTHRKVRRARDFRIAGTLGTRSRHLGMVRWPHAEDLTQPSVHRGGYGIGHLVQGRGILSALETHPAQGAGTRERTGPDLGRRAPCCRVKGGRRFNDSTGDGSPPQGWAQDRVSQRLRRCLCNNPHPGGKSAGAVDSCYGSAGYGRGRARPGQSGGLEIKGWLFSSLLFAGEGPLCLRCRS